MYLEPGHVSIHDDRWLTRPWGVLGGLPGGRSTKLLRRVDGTEEVLPAKCDEIAVEPGDMLIYRTAGGGGWKDRLDRPVEAVERDVSFGLVSVEGAQARLRRDRRRRRGTEAERRASGPSAATRRRSTSGRRSTEAIANCEAETGLPAPSPAKPLRWSPLEDRESRLARVRNG